MVLKKLGLTRFHKKNTDTWGGILIRYKGTIGEQKAISYLINNDYIILQQNYYTRFGELDIIAKKKNRIHIIEVKLVVKQLIHSGYKLNYKKRKRMIQSTQCFMDRSGLTNYFYQFDLITIVDDQIKHLKHIFNLTDI